MATKDRLAAFKAQRDGAAAQRPQSEAPFNSYPKNINNNNNYEMQQAPSNGGGMQTFYAEITSIQDDLNTFNANVSRISDLHSRSLNALDGNGASQNAALLDETTAETRQISNRIKERIKSLAAVAASGQDGAIRKNQITLVKNKFLESLQRYQQVEQEYRSKYKQRVERQFRIVKPDATPEQVSAVVNDDNGGNQVFAQALSSSGRYQEGRAAQREVQERHQDIKKMTETLAELAQLFNDMAVLVEQQDTVIDNIQTTARNVEHDAEAGDAQVAKAVVSARAARKKKWICFGIFVTILAIIAIVLAVYFTRPKAGAPAPAAA